MFLAITMEVVKKETTVKNNHDSKTSFFSIRESQKSKISSDIIHGDTFQQIRSLNYC